MIKNYEDFLDVCVRKCTEFAQIPSECLNHRGEKTYALYRAVTFNSAFASSAHELLELMRDDSDLEIIAVAVPVEYKQIVRCLERLSKHGECSKDYGSNNPVAIPKKL